MLHAYHSIYLQGVQRTCADAILVSRLGSQGPKVGPL